MKGWAQDPDVWGIHAVYGSRDGRNGDVMNDDESDRAADATERGYWSERAREDYEERITALVGEVGGLRARADEAEARATSLELQNAYLTGRVQDGVFAAALLVQHAGGVVRVPSILMATTPRDVALAVEADPLTGDLVFRVKKPS